MVGAEHLFADFKCALIKRLGFGVLAGLATEIAEIIKAFRSIDVLRSKLLLVDRQCSEFERLGFGKLAFIAIKPAKITSGGGRIGMVGEHYRTKNAKGLGPHNSTRAREALPFEK
jgi:hypothetical protein